MGEQQKKTAADIQGNRIASNSKKKEKPTRTGKEKKKNGTRAGAKTENSADSASRHVSGTKYCALPLLRSEKTCPMRDRRSLGDPFG